MLRDGYITIPGYKECSQAMESDPVGIKQEAVWYMFNMILQLTNPSWTLVETDKQILSLSLAFFHDIYYKFLILLSYIFSCFLNLLLSSCILFYLALSSPCTIIYVVFPGNNYLTWYSPGTIIYVVFPREQLSYLVFPWYNNFTCYFSFSTIVIIRSHFSQ